jgi:hypothetical protein
MKCFQFNENPPQDIHYQDNKTIQHIYVTIFPFGLLAVENHQKKITLIDSMVNENTKLDRPPCWQ